MQRTKVSNNELETNDKDKGQRNHDKRVSGLTGTPAR